MVMDEAANPVEIGFFSANAIAPQADIATHTLDKGAGHVNTRYCRDHCIYRQYIGFVQAILRVIILGLAQYQSAVFRKIITINDLWFCEGWILRTGTWDTAHARLAREGVWLV